MINRSIGFPIPKRVSGNELVERLFGENLSSIRKKAERRSKEEPSTDFESSVALLVAESSSSSVTEPSELDSRFAETLRAHRSGEKCFEVTPIGNPKAELPPGVGEEAYALSSVRMLASEGGPATDTGMLLRHDAASKMSASLLKTMTEVPITEDGLRAMFKGEPDTGTRTLLAQLAEHLCIALDRVLIRVEPIDWASGEAVAEAELKEKLRITVFGPLPLRNAQLKEFVESGQVTEIFADPDTRENAIGWTARLTGISALKMLERDMKSLTVLNSGGLGDKALRMVIAVLTDRRTPVAWAAGEVNVFIMYRFKDNWVRVLPWSLAGLKLLRGSPSSAPWLAAFSDQALEDAYGLFGGTLGALRRASEQLRDPAQDTWFLGLIYEELARLTEARPRWLSPDVSDSDPRRGWSLLTSALGNFVLGNARSPHHKDKLMPGLEDRDRWSSYETFRFAHQVPAEAEARPWSSRKFLPPDLGLDASVVKRLTAEIAEERVRPEHRAVCKLARRGVLALQRSVVFNVQLGEGSPRGDSELSLGVELEDSSEGLSAVLAQSARALTEIVREKAHRKA